MKFLMCPECGEKLIFPLMDEHFQDDHPVIWESFKNSHFSSFSEFLYNYFFMSKRETCKHCNHKTKFLSIMRGYDQLCFWCKNAFLYQRCLVCGCYIPFPQLDSHVRSNHPNFRSARAMYKSIKHSFSEPKSCIVCGKETEFYSFGFCPLCEECCRVDSLFKFTNIIDFWKKHFGSEEKALALAAKLGDEECQNRQKLLEEYILVRVKNGYKFYFIKSYLETILVSLAKEAKIHFDPDYEFDVDINGKKFIFTFAVPLIHLCIDLISWNFSPGVNAPHALIAKNITLRQDQNFREEAYKRAMDLGAIVVVISEPAFLKDPAPVLTTISSYFSSKSSSPEIVKFT